ncbi:MAG: APC family permease [Candidatus Acidiferrales bacterium]
MPLLPRIKRFLVGSPLHSAQLHEQKLSKKAALTVFASDNLSSNAYATEEILLVLVPLGVLMADPERLRLVVPVAATIAVLLTIVVLSYGQLIRAFPGGGGTYEVAKDNLGVGAGLVAAAALLIDYILTVAVSVAAGIAALTSAFRVLLPYRTVLCLVAIAVLSVVNLRGARESARAFAFPVYTFLFSIFAMIGVGIYRHWAGYVPAAAPAEIAEGAALGAGSIGAFLMLRAFAHGCVALTGVEAVADGVQALKEPVVRNAQIVLYVMAAILASLFLGLSYLAYIYTVRPLAEETVVSQLARTVFGSESVLGGGLYYVTQISTTAILVLAANTSFAGFPRLASILARDRFVPRQLANVGDRLVFSNGILILAVGAFLLIAVFRGDVHSLIPLYAIGVFLSFTLAQTGLVLHWWKSREPGRHWRLALNALGALATATVLAIIALIKFTEGAWLVIFAVPAVMWIFWKTRRHYFLAAKQLSLSGAERSRVSRHTVIVPVANTPNRVVLTAVEYAMSISRDVIPITVNTDGRSHDEIRQGWRRIFPDADLVILDSPYRSVAQPLLRFIDEIEDLREDDKVTVLLPEYVPAKWWHNLLHNQTSLVLKGALLFKPRIVVTSVPTHLRE